MPNNGQRLGDEIAKQQQTLNEDQVKVFNTVAVQEMRHSMHRFTENALTWRNKLMSLFFDRRRNLESECGYPEDLSQLTPHDYKNLWEREPLPARVINLYPLECWQVCPWVYETEDLEEEMQFEAALKELGRTLESPGYYEDDENNPLWRYIELLDIVSGIGHYGCLFMGFDDVSEKQDLEKPVKLKERSQDLDEVIEEPLEEEPIETEDVGEVPEPIGPPKWKPERKLMFLRVLDETQATIANFDENPKSPRFGQPEFYNLDLSMPTSGLNPQASAYTSSMTTRVHWTRILHAAEHTGANKWFAMPRCQQVYNRLYDCHKLLGGSAEMYWKAAFYGISFETIPQVGADADVDIEALRQTIEKWENSLSRAMFTPGITAKTLAPGVSDPTPQLERQVEAICILLGVPKRVFMGSERGELSSNQDIRAWYAKVKKRQLTYVTPCLVVPFIDRLIQAGVLPEPAQYRVEWPDVASMTDMEKAQVFGSRMEAYSKYIGGGVEALMEPRDMLVREGGFSLQEAEEIMEAKMEAIEAGEIKDPMAAPEVPIDPVTGEPLNPITGEVAGAEGEDAEEDKDEEDDEENPFKKPVKNLRFWQRVVNLLGRDTKGKFGGGPGAGRGRKEGRDKVTHDANRARTYRPVTGVGNDIYFARRVKMLGGKITKNGMDVTVAPPMAAGDEFWNKVGDYGRFYHCDHVKNYSEDQPRDEQGRFGEGGDGSDSGGGKSGGGGAKDVDSILGKAKEAAAKAAKEKNISKLQKIEKLRDKAGSLKSAKELLGKLPEGHPDIPKLKAAIPKMEQEVEKRLKVLD